VVGRSGDGIPVEARFSVAFQTGPGAHPGSDTMDTWSFSGLKRSGHDVNQPLPSIAEVKERVELYFYPRPTLCTSRQVVSWPLPFKQNNLCLSHALPILTYLLLSFLAAHSQRTIYLLIKIIPSA